VERTLNQDQDKAELLRRLGLLRPDSPRRWGRMTAPQMVCHLIDSHKVALGELTVSPDMTLFTRTVMKWIALKAPLPWPPGIGTRPEIDQVLGGGTKPADFTADVAEIARLTERLAAERDFTGRTHPIFGAMSAADWLRWGYLHMDHHLRQFGV